MGTSDGHPDSTLSGRSAACLGKFCDLGKSSLFRIGKQPATAAAASSSLLSSSSSSSKECWIDASTLGILHLGGGGGGGESERGNSFSGWFSRHVASAATNIKEKASFPLSTGQAMPPSPSPSSPSPPSPSSFIDLGTFIRFNEIPLTSTWSAWLERTISEYILAITVGCVLGAAVATGASVGLLAASGMLRASNKYVPVLYNWCQEFYQRIIGGEHSQQQQQQQQPQSAIEDSGDNTQNGNGAMKNGPTNVSIISSGSASNVSLMLLKASGSTTCEKCLQDISVLLSKNGATWKQVRQLSVYLVSSGTIEPVDFREALKEYPINTSTCIVSIRYVQRLEDKDALVEVEAVAAVSSGY